MNNKLKVLSDQTAIPNEELKLINGGYWKNIWSVGPGVYQYNTSSHQYRWIQTQSNSSYTLQTIANGWVGSAGGGYLSGGKK
ncbi:lactococcin family bacteriocin [Leuconostoc suionicum]|uniref:lactococcin family bacteriocin n=1 Tax=Leuconostoc suionicum TaxID=1511761 RepID=UPI0032DEE5D2